MLRNSLLTILFLVGCSAAAFGQSNNPPPKEKPPVIPVKPKETPKPTPKPEKPNKSSDFEMIGFGRFNQD